MHTRPATLRRRPPSQHRPDEVAARGHRPRSPSGTSASPSLAGRGRVPVRHPLPGRHPLHHRHPASSVIAGPARTSLRPRDRREPVDRDARPDQVVVGPGRGQGRGRVGQVPHLRVDPGRRAAATRLGEHLACAASSGARARRRTRSGSRCRPPRRRPRPPPCPRRSTSSGQSAAVAPPRDSPVSTLRCTRAGGPVSRAAAATSASAQGALTDRSTSARPPAARPRRAPQPGQHRRR